MQLLHVFNQARRTDQSHWWCRPNKCEAKYGNCACCVIGEVCDIHHVTPKVFYSGHVTPPSGPVTPKSVLYSEYKMNCAFDSPTQNTICLHTCKSFLLKRQRPICVFNGKAAIISTKTRSIILSLMVPWNSKSSLAGLLKSYIYMYMENWLTCTCICCM